MKTGTITQDHAPAHTTQTGQDADAAEGLHTIDLEAMHQDAIPVIYQKQT